MGIVIQAAHRFNKKVEPKSPITTTDRLKAIKNKLKPK